MAQHRLDVDRPRDLPGSASWWRSRRSPPSSAGAVAVDAQAQAQTAQGRIRSGATGSIRRIRNALAAVPIDALGRPSKAIVVDVDNAVRTSDSELALAVEEFGTTQTAPFSTAVSNAKTTLAQAFNVRQILDDAVPESAQQRRDLLTRVIVAAAKADRELDAQTDAFDKLRDLVINAPTRLDGLTQQMVDLTARVGPSEQALTALHNQTRRHRIGVRHRQRRGGQTAAGLSPDQNISPMGRQLVARPAGQQMGLVDSRSAPPSRRSGRPVLVLDAVGQRGHGHQPGGGHPAIGDHRHPERHHAGEQPTPAAQYSTSDRAERRSRRRGGGRR